MERNLKVLLLFTFLALMLPAGLAHAATSGGGPGPSASCFPTNNDICSYYSNGHYRIFYAIFCTVQQNLTSALFDMYRSVILIMQPIVRILLTMYIALYGFGLMMGFSDTSPREIFPRIFKIMFVWVMFSDPCVFYTYVYSFFMNGLHQIALFAIAGIPGVDIGGGGDPTSSNLFTHIDTILETQLEAFQVLGAAFAAFLFTGPGAIISFLIFSAGVSYFFTLLRLFMSMAIAIVSLTISLMFAPLFFCFLLFGETADLFRNWLSLIVGYTVQPAILLFYLVVMTKMTELEVVTSRLQKDGVIVPHFYNIDWWFIKEGINGYALGTNPATGLQYTLKSDYIFPLTSGESIVMPIYVGLTMFSLILLILSIVTAKFTPQASVIARAIGQLQFNIHAPLISVQDRKGGGGSINSGYIIPGLTPGAIGTDMIEGDFSNLYSKSGVKEMIARRAGSYAKTEE